MGQYYKPVNLDKKEYLYSHDFKTRYTREDGTSYISGEGLKLMEHSYIGNKLMNAIERLLIPSGGWYMNRLVWAGDYANPEKGHEGGKEFPETNVYDLIEIFGSKIKPSTRPVNKKYHFLTNHTKRLVVDLAAVKADKEGWKIHPLPLLVCEGNGKGGGDFIGVDERIGNWARDVISLENHLIEDYQLSDGQFKEER